MKKITVFFTAFVMILGLVACGAPEEEQPEEQIDYEIAMVTDTGLLMNGGYSEVAWATISEFGASEGISHKYYKASEATERAYKETIDNAVEKGAKLIIADGDSFEDAVFDSQSAYPDVKFVLIDGGTYNDTDGNSNIGKNTVNIMFDSAEAGYLAGYGAVSSGFTSLGFIGDSDGATVTDYGYGFLQGADKAATEQNVKVKMRYEYNDDAEWRDIVSKASSWYVAGTELIFACGDNVELPVVEAAELAEGKVIAAETDKQNLSDTIVASVIKNFSDALEEILELYAEDEFPGGSEISYNIENKGVTLVTDKDSLKGFSKAEQKNVKAELASGDIIVKRHEVKNISALGLNNIKIKVTGQ